MKLLHSMVAVTLCTLVLSCSAESHSGSRPNYVLPEIIKVTSLPDFSAYKDVTQKKKAFFDFMRPIIQSENARVAYTRKRLQTLARSSRYGQHIKDKDAQWIRDLAVDYKVEMTSIQDEDVWRALLKKVDIVPLKLALAQAANESSWGTSRFAREGFNMFGMWCFSKGCGLVPSRRPPEMLHEVAVFDSIDDSVAAYILHINRNKTYKPLRRIRTQMRAENEKPTALKLAEGLSGYSERGEACVQELQSIIQSNAALMDGVPVTSKQ